MKKINRLLFYLSKLGLQKFMFFIISKLFSLKSDKYYIYQKLFLNKKGLEIGGPSKLFEKNNFLQIYNDIESLDGVNFSSQTLWENNLKQGKNYKYSIHKENGFQFICDAIDLSTIKSNSYDFVLSCNNLEHIANPIKAINEWIRILKAKGEIVLILPNKLINFDHKRQVTSLNHIKDDYKNDTGEDDMTHLREILKFHDLNLDPELKSFNHFKERCNNNFENRAMHHHVYDLDLLNNIFTFLKIETILKHSTVFNHYIVGRKLF